MSKKRDDVGYGRPPKEHQFRSGQSGNPKGRPKGRLGMAGLLQKAITERVTVTENGRRRSFSKAQLAFKQITNKAASGDLRALALLFELIQHSESRSVDASTPYNTDSDAAVMKALSTRFQQELEDVEEERGE